MLLIKTKIVIRSVSIARMVTSRKNGYSSKCGQAEHPGVESRPSREPQDVSFHEVWFDDHGRDVIRQDMMP